MRVARFGAASPPKVTSYQLTLGSTQDGNMRFTDKVAIVTGAGQGIGEAYAKALAREGAAVVIAEINETTGPKVAGEIVAAGGRAVFVRTDVASPESAGRLAADSPNSSAMGQPRMTPPDLPMLWSN